MDLLPLYALLEGEGFKPPKGVAKAAARGLEYRQKAGGKGGLSAQQASEQGIGSGVQRAANLKNRSNLSLDTVERMKAFFDRHEKNKDVAPGKEPWQDRGHVAWLLWGGDEGRAWANRVLAKKESVDLQEKGPSVQKHGVPRSRREASAMGIRKAAEKVKDQIQKKILNAIAAAMEDGEAREACTLFGKLSAEGRKALPSNFAYACGEGTELQRRMYGLLEFRG